MESPPGRKRRLRTPGGLVTIGTVAVLVAGMAATVFGLGAADQAVASFDAASWLWSRSKGELARANGVTGRVDTRFAVAGAAGHPMQVTQTDRFLILRDLNTGLVSSLDLTSLQTVATRQTTAGVGVTVALNDDAAFIIDSVQGEVRQLDPQSLEPVGEPVRYPPGIAGGTFDGESRLWIAVPSEGTVSAITPAVLSTGKPKDGEAAEGGQGAAGPKLIRTHGVAAPSHDLTLTALDNGVGVLDRTTNTLTMVRGEAAPVPVTLTLTGVASLPERTTGAQIPVTVADVRKVYVVSETGVVTELAVPGDGAPLRPAMAWAGRFYVPEQGTGVVHVLDVAGQQTSTFTVAGANGELELEVRENHLFVNAPNSSNAQVVDDKHEVRSVDKYANDVLGGDPPKEAPAPPPPPAKPQIAKPGAPKQVTAAAGNAQIRLSWKPAAANGAAITKYVVEGADKTWQVGADQRALQVDGLTNGETYTFTVYAVNSEGEGPKAKSNPAVPTSEVPDAPTEVTAAAQPDGTVKITWPAANGQGLKIKSYAVNAISAGATALVGQADGTELVVAAGELEYGTQYAFTVTSTNERGGSSAASPVSGTVVPFAVPDAPKGLDAATVAGERGTVTVTWTAPAENGRPITKYLVNAGDKTAEVAAGGTKTKLTGFGDGQNVSVKVRAVNEAGEGPQATATARTVAAPKVTVTGSSVTQTALTVKATVDAGGGTATCKLVASGKSVSGACASLTLSGLSPSTKYDFTLTATNAAGNASATGSNTTSAVYGLAVCYNNTSANDEAQHTWCNDKDNGRQVWATPKDKGTLIGRASQEQRLSAICKENGQSISQYVYNKGKADPTSIWIKVNYGGTTGYISFAWFNLEGYGINSTGPLPDC
ncbi:fibronectin type III domain-containing protein [Catenuloplanes sp. NPDC051500]|uniref:fibronectin type III domain-containing protein n=1 Tax=Catenuloplanes sp. NPDC051500 TaxID=3363959 RepID=UPI0037902970